MSNKENSGWCKKDIGIFPLIIVLAIVISWFSDGDDDKEANVKKESITKSLTKLELANKRISDSETQAISNCIVKVEDYASRIYKRTDVDKTWGALDPPKTITTAEYSTLENPNFVWQINFASTHFEFEKTGQTFGATCIYDPNRHTATIIELN